MRYVVGGWTWSEFVTGLVEHAAASAIDENRVDGRSGLDIDETARDTFGGEMTVSEGSKGNEHGPEVAAFLGQDVFVPRGMFRITPPFEKPRFDERIQAPRQHIGRDLEARQELVEARETVKGVAQDEHAPPFADSIERPGDRAKHVAESRFSHRLRYIGLLLAKC
jgi:hypothetical protein